MRTRRGLPTLAALGWTAGLVTILAAGCGEGSTPADQYTGTWRYDDATSIVQCLNADPLVLPPLKNKTFAPGLGAEIVDLSSSPLEKGRVVNCNFAFDVAGPVARALPDQSCQLNTIDVLTIDSGADGKPAWTFTLNSPTKAEELATSTIHIFQTTTTPPTETTCAWSLTAHLTRITKD